MDTLLPAGVVTAKVLQIRPEGPKLGASADSAVKMITRKDRVLLLEEAKRIVAGVVVGFLRGNAVISSPVGPRQLSVAAARPYRRTVVAVQLPVEGAALARCLLKEGMVTLPTQLSMPVK